MTILEGDIQILSSQVLADVAEGGGAATGAAIVDGVSNNLFDDISELDRTVGRVNLRKVFPAVRTASTDGYFGAHAIISDAPDDANVSAVLFDTGDHFDTRTAAQSRIEAYLAQGPASVAILFGDHIAGMMTVSVLQRLTDTVLTNSATIVLRKDEGLVTQTEQFLRITDVSSQERQFTVAGTTFTRRVVNYTTSDPLREDYPGFQAAAAYNDAELSFVGKTRVYDTIVADAARYYGIVPLDQAAAVSDSVIYADGIYTQLVPSAQVETAIADARINQQTAALVAAGETLSRSITGAFSATASLYIGGGILPGSLSIARDAITLTDLGGVLYNSTTQVGTVDYANGLLSLTTSVWGTSGTFVITYAPAAAPVTVTRSAGIPVTASGHRLTYILTLDPVPAKATLQVSYLAGGRWYVLQEDGSGAVRGSDTAFGAGNLNYDTGTVSLTLGALPDIGSQVIFAWAPSTAPQVVNTAALSGGRLRFELNFASTLKLGATTITWNDGIARTATVGSTGAITGDATGSGWSYGGVHLSPNTLPPSGTVFTLETNLATVHTLGTTSLTDNTSAWTGVIPGAPLQPYTVQMVHDYDHPEREFPGTDETVTRARTVTDNGAGALLIGATVVGSVNYSTGAFSLTKSVGSFATVQKVYEKIIPTGASNPADPTYVWYTGTETRLVTITARQLSTTASAAASSSGASHSATATGSALVMAPAAGSDIQLSTFERVGWKIGTARYSASGVKVWRDINASTGIGTVAGALDGNRITVTSWPAAASSTATEITGTTAPSIANNPEAITDGVVFRTASTPIKPGSFSCVGQLRNNATFNVTDAGDGTINGGGVVGRIDYQRGVVQLRFGVGTAAPASDVGVVSANYLALPGINNIAVNPARADTLRYSAASYTYIPLDADILGLDPVRLPPDGRVPIFRSGSVAVVHHTANTAPATVSNGQTVDCARTRLARARVVGANGLTIASGYTADLDAGTVTFTNVTGYSQPVHVEHRIEDTALVSEAQISGQLKLTRPLTHDFPDGSYVSSALLMGDQRARVSAVFDQGTWTEEWSDDLIGSASGATFDQINNPITVDNLGAFTERWVLRFTGSTAFSCYGEHIGLVGTGTTASEFAPLNPASGTPYFRVPALGWGGGWSTGNVLRVNTIGALSPVWVARVIKQGAATAPNDSFTILVRGDIDTP